MIKQFELTKVKPIGKLLKIAACCSTTMKMVNDTDNYVTFLEQQNEHQQVSTVNHVMQELRDTDALKEKLRNIFDCNTVIVSTTSKEN